MYNIYNDTLKQGKLKPGTNDYVMLHQWINNFKFRTGYCDICGKKKKLDLANTLDIYNKDFNNYELHCRQCHMKVDNRINNLNQYQKKKAWNKGLIGEEYLKHYKNYFGRWRLKRK